MTSAFTPPPWVVPRSQMPRNAGGLGTSCKLIGRPKPPMWDDLFVFNFFSIHRHFWAFGTAGRAMPGVEGVSGEVGPKCRP